MQSQSFLNIISFLRGAVIFRKLILLALDSILISCAYAFSFWLRLDVILPYSYEADWEKLFLHSLPLLLGVRLVFNWLNKMYSWSFSHVGIFEASRLASSTLMGAIVFFLLNKFFTPFFPVIPRSVYIIEGLCSFISLSFVRFFPKYLYITYCHYYKKVFISNDSLINTIIYGAGGSAELLVKELTRTTNYKYNIIGLIDDSPTKKNASIYGFKVLGAINDLPKILEKFSVNEILITIPDFSGKPLRNLIGVCAPFNIGYKIVPRYKQILNKTASIASMMEKIKPDALIDRVQIPFDKNKLFPLYKGKTILVTGGVGSIGSEICRQLTDCKIARLIVLDMNENDSYFLQSDLREKHPDLDLFFEIGSIQDREIIRKMMEKYRPHIVFHAAAHKHVPLMERCPLEAIKNNVLGTIIVIEEAQRQGVEEFLLISSDKSVSPTNIMGATKNIAEKVMRSLKIKGPMKCRTVRFGNVLGSNGSLLQIIQRQVIKGGPITITHPEMTRYFMTIPEAVGLVLVTLSFRESDTFVLDMGNPISIDKLIRQVVSLSGLVPERDIDIVYTQCRPGEKMHEEIFSKNENIEKTAHKRIFSVINEEEPLDVNNIKIRISTLSEQEELNIKQFLLDYVTDYQPVSK